MGKGNKAITFEGVLSFQANRHEQRAEQGEDDSLPDRIFVGSGAYNESFHKVDVTDHLTGGRTEDVDVLLELSDGHDDPERGLEWTILCDVLPGRRVRVTIELL